MNKQTLRFPLKASRRDFLKGSAVASAAVLARPVSLSYIDVSTEESTGILPPPFSGLKPLGSRVHPVTTEEFQGRLQHAQKLMGELSPNYDAMFVAPGTSLYSFTGIRWGVSERLLALVQTMAWEDGIRLALVITGLVQTVTPFGLVQALHLAELLAAFYRGMAQGAAEQTPVTHGRHAVWPRSWPSASPSAATSS